MKQFIVDRHTTPNTPTLEQVPTEKIPVYNDLDAAVADLANLAENQIIATHDTGSELSAPVDVVQSGNMHAVTSNAVAEALSYSTEEHFTGRYWYNGKKIYEKTYHIENINPDGGNKTLDISALNADEVVEYRGIVFRRYHASDYVAYPWNCYENSNNFNSCGRNKNVTGGTDSILYVLNYHDSSTTDAVLSLLYTKTTD